MLAAACLAGALALAPLAAEAAPQAAKAHAAPDQAYALRYGDTLNIELVGKEKLKLEAQPIRPDGRVSVPMVGEVQASGLTVRELTERLTQAYAKFYVHPQVVVNVAEFRPLKIYVLGLVNRPGTYTVSEPVPLLEAIALAGGFDRDRANLSQVVVLRASGERHVVDLLQMLEGRGRIDVRLADGDTVKIEEVFGPDWYRLLPPLASSLSIASTIIVLLGQYYLW